MNDACDEKIIKCVVTFLSADEGGRSHPFGNGLLSDYRYRPHLVVGDPTQGEAIVEGNTLLEDYLGVAFIEGPLVVETGVSIPVTACLIYHPNVDYSRLTVGATFTIREGGKIVGYGEVIEAGQRAG